jgi:SHS family lactate transporter-like MFS transporter
LAPSLALFFLLRAFFGIAMGGEWGAGSSLVMESVPPPARGFVSGILQAGYSSGYLLASLAYAFVDPITGWRGLMMLALLPAFLVLYIRKNIPESHVLKTGARAFPDFRNIFSNHWRTVLFAVFLMTAFNFLSHGTQDLYPSFLESVHHLSPREVGTIAVLYNVGAILGGMTLSTLSERIGRRKAIFMAAVLALCCTPFWGSAHGTLVIAVGAFLMQFFVQGAWGVVPVYLNEISPSAIRGVFPGLVYQFGNLLASANATIQSAFSVRLGGRLDIALMAVAGLSAILIALLIMAGPERRGEVLGGR